MATIQERNHSFRILFVFQNRLHAITLGKVSRQEAEALQRPAFLRERAAELHRKVLGPLGNRIAGKALVIVPDGVLCLLPFELLGEGQTEEDDGHSLIEKHRIRYAPSLTTLHLSQQASAARARKPTDLLWALADPIFDSKDPRNNGETAVSPGPLWAGGTTFPRLRHSADEAVRKALNVSAEKVFKGTRVGEAQFKASSTRGDLSRARFVHFATHGIVDERSALGTGLVLNLIGNDEREELGGINDGFLRLPEVTFLNLNAEVVVLSSCETGRGRRNRSEGISGLARAFLYASSKGVVCSLWSVDDVRTGELMADFYKGLKEEKPTNEALREAQLRMIRAGRAPFFWGPFVLMGE